MRVILFGGPRHGKVVDVRPGTPRITFAMAPHLGPTAELYGYMHRPEQVTYEIREYREFKFWPERSRSVFVGVIKGEEPSRLKASEFDRELGRGGWSLLAGNFETDFDQWFSAQVYRLMGRLWWQGMFVDV